MSLNHRQKAFVLAYCKHGNATQAAKDAGYSQKTAGQKGHSLLKNSEIAQAVKDHQDEAGERAVVDAAWVLERMAHEAKTAKNDNARVNALNLLGKHFQLWDRRTEQVDVDWASLTDEQIETLIRAQQEGEVPFRRALRELVN